jgi:hypothetical protein
MRFATKTKGRIEIQPVLNPISYEKPGIKILLPFYESNNDHHPKQ